MSTSRAASPTRGRGWGASHTPKRAGEGSGKLESKSHSKSVRVRIETAEDLPTVHGFGSELNQVWEKLIDNAIDAAPVGGNVTLTATRRGDFVAVVVTDDGPGIPEEHRARIFD